MVGSGRLFKQVVLLKVQSLVIQGKGFCFLEVGGGGERTATVLQQCLLQMPKALFSLFSFSRPLSASGLISLPSWNAQEPQLQHQPAQEKLEGGEEETDQPGVSSPTTPAQGNQTPQAK